MPLQTRFIKEPIAYSGEQLRSLWLYEAFDLIGDAAVAFIGPCDVQFEHMRDMEDLKDRSRIYSELMLHFIFEHFECDLERTVLRQWAFAALLTERLNARLGAPRIRREGSDLYDGDRKVTVSIAAPAAASGLIHTGVNISSRNTPVPTHGLEDFGIAPRPLAEEMLAAYARDMAAVRRARCKVRACP